MYAKYSKVMIYDTKVVYTGCQRKSKNICKKNFISHVDVFQEPTTNEQI